ncbi:MAG: CHASE2 domain-containing protein [Gammaproteobacteria bacterium]|nr:CHASE2 domain-containing protein [Gammaproteobacteria bacterium]
MKSPIFDPQDGMSITMLRRYGKIDAEILICMDYKIGVGGQVLYYHFLMRSIIPLIKLDWFVGLVITVLFLVLAEAGLFSALDRKAYDLGVRLSADKEPLEDIAIVAIDDKSLKALGAWPWTRDVLAETTLVLGRAKPRVIGLNLSLDGEQNQAARSSLTELRAILKKEKKLSTRVNRALRVTETALRGDDKLAASFKGAGRIVLAMPYTATSEPISGLPPSLSIHMQRFDLPDVSVANVSRGFGWPAPRVTLAAEIFPPLNKLTRQVGAVGVISTTEYFSSEPLIVQYGNEYLPSFALMLATRSKGMSMQHIGTKSSVNPMLGDKDLRTDIDLRIYPRFYQGSDGKPAFPVYSLIDVLDGSVDMRLFNDKIVIIGLDTPRLEQPMLTPTGESISSTLAAAHTVSSILKNEQYRSPEWNVWVQRGLIVVVGIYLILLLGRFRNNTAFFLSLFLLVMIFNAHFLLMSSQSLWLPMMAAAVMLIVGHLVLGTRKAIQAHLDNAQSELSAVNLQLGMSLQAQGQLDQAFARYRSCRVDEALLGQVYNIGLDYERKRQFNKAGAVFKFILEHEEKFNDVGERLAQNDHAANTVVLAGRDTNGPGPNLISSSEGVQKPKLGRYRIDSEIGRGAMGMVYLGRDEKIGRTVAIKTMMLGAEIEDDMRDEVKARFFREAEAAGRLDHPNIVTVYDVGDEQDLAYIAMDYLKGKDLTAYNTSKTLLPASQVFHIVGSVALALDYAHKQYVVHRDIKPANIIYDHNKRAAKITDFGVACLTDASKTKAGMVLGSPYYMSPEQIAGKKVDGRTDLFALGVTLYQMLSGELPFQGESIANLMFNITNEQHPDIRRSRADLPNCVNSLINKALQKEAGERFQNGIEMAAAMKRCQQHIREMEAA